LKTAKPKWKHKLSETAMHNIKNKLHIEPCMIVASLQQLKLNFFQSK